MDLCNISQSFNLTYGRHHPYPVLQLMFILSVVNICRLYQCSPYLEITKVSPAIGSLQGGTRVVIEGRNFDDTVEPIAVFIGRVPCEVITGTLTHNSVECIAGDPPPVKEYYPSKFMGQSFVETRFNK